MNPSVSLHPAVGLHPAQPVDTISNVAFGCKENESGVKGKTSGIFRCCFHETEFQKILKFNIFAND